MPDDHIGENAGSELERNELIGLVGNAYAREGLSPPSQIYRAAEHWLGLSAGEILAILEQHFDRSRQFYLSGSGDGLFYLVQADIRRAIDAKRPTTQREPERPPRPRSRVVTIHNPSGFNDVYVEGSAARLVRERDKAALVERTSLLGGYERPGTPIEDEAR
jgi:hypothetical protein